MRPDRGAVGHLHAALREELVRAAVVVAGHHRERAPVERVEERVERRARAPRPASAGSPWTRSPATTTRATSARANIATAARWSASSPPATGRVYPRRWASARSPRGGRPPPARAPRRRHRPAPGNHPVVATSRAHWLRSALEERVRGGGEGGLGSSGRTASRSAHAKAGIASADGRSRVATDHGRGHRGERRSAQPVERRQSVKRSAEEDVVGVVLAERRRRRQVTVPRPRSGRQSWATRATSRKATRRRARSQRGVEQVVEGSPGASQRRSVAVGDVARAGEGDHRALVGGGHLGAAARLAAGPRRDGARSPRWRWRPRA